MEGLDCTVQKPSFGVVRASTDDALGRFTDNCRIRGSTDADIPRMHQTGSMALRVVLVDDDQRFRAMACRALAAEGVEVVAEVERGVDVIEAVESWKPDVVLMDIRMPDVDGPEVARRLRQRSATPVVILISTVDVVSGRRLADGVAAGYLPKDELSLAAIHNLLLAQ